VREIKFTCPASTCAPGKHGLRANWTYTYDAYLYTSCTNSLNTTVVYSSVKLELVAQVVATGGAVLVTVTHKVYGNDLTGSGTINTTSNKPLTYVFGGSVNLVSGQSYSVRTYWTGTTFAWAYSGASLCKTSAQVNTGRAGTTVLNSVEVA
jgi:hypothetical protein